MEKKVYKRTLWEVYGDLIATPGKRFLVSAAMAAVCGVLGSYIVIGIFAFGMVAFVYVAISFVDSTKTYYHKTVTVRTETGETVPCIIVKQKCYAYCIFPFIYFCVFYYLPYRVRYYLIKNVEPSDMKEGTQIESGFIPERLVDLEEIPKSYAKAIMKNPQLLSEEMSERVPEYRRQFCEDIEPFVKEGLLEELYFNSRFSICRLCEKDYIVCHYERSTGAQRGICIKSTYVDTIKEDPAYMWKIYSSATEEFSVGRLSEQTFEQLLWKKNGNN